MLKPLTLFLYVYFVCRILAEEGLASCATESATIVTPTGDSFTGLLPVERVCAVSIIRAGDSLLDAVLSCDPTVAVGTRNCALYTCVVCVYQTLLDPW